MTRSGYLLPAIAALALAACASAPTPGPTPEPEPAPERAPWDDGDPDYGPDYTPDLSGVTEPEPRDEPRSRWGNPETYEVFGVTYRLMEQGEGHVEEGIASWYGKKFHGRRTSSGEPYDMYAMTAAHKKLPIPIYARVTNLENGRSVVVRINDRGPFAHDRIIDMSYAAAYRLDMVDSGTARVRVETLTRNLDAEDTTAGTGNGAMRVADSGERTAAPDVRAAPRVQSSVNREDWFLQAGAFGDRTNAERMRARLEAEDLASVVIRSSGDEGPHRVWIGPVDSREAAEALRDRLASRGLGPANIVSPDNAR
ncbi:rare lipoprotein A [Natronocella acetinitrilica]|uniref:Endolytic peptidoglycan transglycosylase RlpA n=1 Tax=Natronocella acetinitrilica TaxID=414046 RepID=A0AAE3G0B5_9GAMM|nr:rare lipoprotein A [Natronocella acetinitrilica]